MIKTVCFDFFNTLAYFYPPREECYAHFASEVGIKVTPEAVGRALPEADRYWRNENFKSPIKERPDKEKYATYTEYAQLILRLAETKPTPEQALQVLAKAFDVGFKFVAFDDALPALRAVKQRNLTAGVISNVGQEIDSSCNEMGFTPYLDFKVTSFEVGLDKPHPLIFQKALEKADVKASEALFIGDQYDQDVVGARKVGMNPVLLVRGNSTAPTDCPVINSLTELEAYLS
jgi:putative hydrolase of the HAD superfamily